MRRGMGFQWLWIVLILAVLALLMVMSPAGLFAKAPATGKDFAKFCDPCHGSVPKYPFLGTRAGYDHSGHKNIGNSYYANGAGCQQCHTNEGFIEYIVTGKIDSEGFVNYPSQPGCFTCHDPHLTADFSLRAAAAVTLANGKTYDQGNGNLCANCHQARRDATAEVKESPAETVRSPWGAHHGPQADMIVGTNAYQFEGQTYSSSDHATSVENGCVTCHMALPAGRYSLSPEVGGHSFNIGGEVHEAEKLNVAGCVECHEDIKQVGGKDIFDVKAADDYDLDGTVEPLQAEVEGLLEKFVRPGGGGYLQKLTPPMYAQDGSWNNSREGTWTIDQMAALYDYKFVLEDRSKGVHNAKYATQILYDALKTLDSGFDVSKRPK